MKADSTGRPFCLAGVKRYWLTARTAERANKGWVAESTCASLTLPRVSIRIRTMARPSMPSSSSGGGVGRLHGMDEYGRFKRRLGGAGGQQQGGEGGKEEFADHGFLNMDGWKGYLKM